MLHVNCRSCGKEFYPSTDAAGSDLCPLCKPPSTALPLEQTLVHPPPTTNGEPAVPGSTIPDSMSSIGGSRPSLDAFQFPGYDVIRELGRGGMGVVYLARQKGLKRHVALKMILAGIHAGGVELSRFRAEAEAAAKLQHPNIVQIHEVGEHEGKPFFSLEFVEGGSLDGKLREGPLTPRNAAVLIETLARAMHHAHQQGIFHRDLKPANVLMARDGTPKITDFGLAKKLDAEDGQTQSGSIMGTPSYMAPEQARGKSKEIGPAADVYALGAVLYELLTGRAPFRGATPMDTVLMVLEQEPVAPSRLTARLPRDLETICLKCLHKEPSRRYDSALELADDLRRFLDGQPIQARPVGFVERAMKWARRKPAAAALLVVIALAAAALIASGLYYNDELRQERDLAHQSEHRATASAKLASVRAIEATNAKQSAQTSEIEARKSEEDARRELDRSQRALIAAQVWRAAGIWDRDPELARELLDDPDTCPPTLRDFSWRLYRRLSALHRGTFELESGSINDLAALPGAHQLFAVAESDGGIRIWDDARPDQAIVLRGHEGAVRAVALSKDGKQLLSGGDDGTVRLWDVEKGEQLRLLGRLRDPVRTVVFRPDGLEAAAGTYHANPVRGDIILWDVNSGKRRPLLSGGRNGILSLAYTPDSKGLVSGMATDHAVVLWDVQTGRRLANIGIPQAGNRVTGLAISPDGRTVAYGIANHTIRMLDVATLAVLPGLRGHTGRIDGVAFSPDGRSLVSVSRDGTLRLWDVSGRTLLTKAAEKPGDATKEMTDAGKERCSINLGQPTPTRIAFTRDGDEMAVATGAVLRRFAVPKEAYGRQLTNHVNRIESIAAHPDSKMVAVLNNRASVLFFDARFGVPTLSRRLSRVKANSAAWMPGGKFLAVVGAGLELPTIRDAKLLEAEVRMVDPDTTGYLVHRGGGKPFTAVAPSPDGKHLAVGDADGLVHLFDITMGKNAPRIRNERTSTASGQPGQATLLVGFSADSKVLVAAQSEAVRRWNVEGFKETPPLAGFQPPLSAATLTPDGNNLLVALPDGRVRLWELASGQQKPFPIERLSDRVQTMTFTRDGKVLATGGVGGAVRLWDLATGRERASLTGHTQGVTCVAFAGNDNLLFSGSGDDKAELTVRAGEALLWDATPLPTRGASRRFVEPGESSSRAVVVGEGALVHTGQLLPLDGRGKMVGKAKPAEQVEKVLDNLDLALAEFRSGLDAVVKLNVYVSRDDIVDEMNRAMARRFPASARPAVSFVAGPLPHPDALVAVDAVAITPDAAEAVRYRTSASLKGQPGEAHAALLPAGARVHVSGQAQKGELVEATRKTLESLRTTLKSLRLTDSHIVQLKAFLMPMSDVAVVEKEIETFFGNGKTPPLVFVEWKASKDSPIEIELIAHAGKAYPSAPDVIDYLTPSGMTASPVFSRVAHIRYGPSIYVSGLFAAKDKLDAKAEVEDLFAQLKSILGKADSDLKHLAKATYYVATDETSKALNDIRPGLYDPKRPPAASKAMVAGTARTGRNITFDMIAVPTLKVPTTPPEMGHGLTAKDAAEGWISVFDGQTTFGWIDGMVVKGVLERGTTETVFGNCALKADVVEPGVLKIAGKEHKVQVGSFTLADTGGKGVIELAGGVKVRSLLLKPLDLKPIFNGKNLDGWKRIDRANLPEKKRPVWKVEKGVIVATGGPGALEYQGAKFGDFVMQVDVRTRVRHANGGVFFRAIPGDFMNGYEAQVYNRCVDGDPSKPVVWTTGAIDNRQNARRLVSRDFETYRMTVIARGAHLSTWINGYQVVDWTDTRSLDPNPRKGMRLEPGVIQLQAHDPLTDVEYQAIQIGE